uniref:non-specific serine/threonine protein kinase n=1 Tax=Bactrocera latifrons TaxID=174628 RepID=A0A0K8VDV3_BACLA
MGKRMAVVEAKHSLQATRTIRKRKRNSSLAAIDSEMITTTAKTTRGSHNYWHENDDEDSSSNEATNVTPVIRNPSTKHANNSSILLSANTSLNESPKPVYTLLPSIVNGTIMYDLMQKPWRLGKPIGKGNFGEIFLASDNTSIPVTNENAKFVVKIEPHSNGPLFVEIHCLMNTAKNEYSHIKTETDKNNRQDYTAPLMPHLPTGIPKYIASGSHYFGDARYRFLVLQRFDRDLHSLIKNCRVHQKCVLTLAIQIVDVLEKLHDKGYCHNDVKAQNLMISKCKYYKKQTATAPVTTGKSKSSRSSIVKSSSYDEHYEEKQQTTDSGNSSEQEVNDDEEDEDFIIKRNKFVDEYEDEDFDDGATTNSNNSNSVDLYETPLNRNRKRRPRNNIEFSGSNPVRSCRRQKRNSIYEEMVKSHYLRPAKRISYSEFFNEDTTSIKDEPLESKSVTTDDDFEEFLPRSARRSGTIKKSSHASNSCLPTTRLTRRQEKIFNKLNANKHLQKTNCDNSPSTAVAESLVIVEEERIFLIDFGLASKFMDNGVHRPFVMDQRRAHDGTLEFTSRDAHMGAHSRRSDLECLGYNLMFWSQGYLPWKDAAIQHQQEKVHRAKEYLMTDVREMLKQIYGKQVPKYLGEFLHQVSQLAYHDRPDYGRYRRLFQREFQQLGYSLAELHLDSKEIVRTCVRVKEEIENKNDIFEMNKLNGNAVWSIMSNLTVGTPFHERTLSNRVSPKNLRSKSDKKSMKKKKFSWAEILSQDPDQIARERAEKEFDREEELSEVQQPIVRRYEGKPTYAILEIENRLRLSGRFSEDNRDSHRRSAANQTDEEDENDEEQDEEEMEVDDTEDMGDNDRDCDDDEDDIETDATDTMDHVPNGGHNTRAHNTRSTRRKDYVQFLETDGRIQSSTKQRSINSTKSAFKTAAATSKSVHVANKVTMKSSSKRSSTAGRSNRKGYNNEGTQVNSNSVGGTGRPERRTRRCLIETETEMNDLIDQQESNSNFNPDVCSLFNVWKKINNENIYYRGNNAAAAASTRQCKK